MKRVVAVALCVMLLSVMASCGRSGETGLYTGDADFTATLSREDGEGTLVLSVTRRGGVSEAHITSPAELEGVCFTRSSGGSSLTADSVTVPLTEEAARGANVLFDALSCPVPETSSSEKTDDGTVYTFERDGAEITLCADGGVPKYAVIVSDGMRRKLEISEFSKK